LSAFIQVTDGVHANGSYIYLQLWALGRAALPDNLEKEGHFPYVSSSNISMSDGRPAPRPLTIDEIKEYISLYSQAAKNAIEAGFDGVEIHGANGYLIDQFIKEVTNKRTDEYGGSVERRARFALEITEAVTKAVGEERTGFRISPWGTFNGAFPLLPVDPLFALVTDAISQK
jgi:NADPH2 dehydrogenase